MNTAAAVEEARARAVAEAATAAQKRAQREVRVAASVASIL